MPCEHKLADTFEMIQALVYQTDVERFLVNKPCQLQARLGAVGQHQQVMANARVANGFANELLLHNRASNRRSMYGS